ncbi:MAG TPA: DUF4190 domain-containing protein [Pseudonocardiaceae bacterium]|nr:DUF4190 domain-containing protein [Pseudonocardiaceae bacterium]
MTTPPNPNWPSGPGDRYTPGASPGGVPPGYPGPYGYQGQPGYPVAGPTNGFAIASLVLGIIWVYWVGSVLALIFGYVALKQIRERRESGYGMAIAGIVLGWVGVGVLALLFIIGFIVGATGGR